MTRRSAAPVLLAAALVLAACTASNDPGLDGAVAPAEVTSANAQVALLNTDGEPLIDPAELIDAASFDGIPAVDEPVLIPRTRAETVLTASEQVMLVEVAGDARAYPVRQLIRHEIVNDVVGGVPVAVTWCPLCNTGITFDRRVDGRTEVFGVSGSLYRSALVMFDRRTTSLWPQPLGRAVLGPMLGAELTVLPSSLLPWSEARDAWPQVRVAFASEDAIDATTNPYEGYDTSGDPFLFRGEADDRLPELERVAGVSFDGSSRAWSYTYLRRHRAVDTAVGGQPLVLLWAPGSVSPLEGDDVRDGRDVGSTAVYDPRIDGRTLTFSPAGRTEFRDHQTGSRWTLAGLAVEGPLAGRRLTPLPHQDAFWFAWAAFQPGTALVSQ
jgi:hypothetical protein